ncbi:heterokaryon incompatibility protein-domain-containing protein [Thelonectria olida]|uniref:Heterokaryon incompatibility protein-domain-containing protein n=1 Tax=Thelonectria olida TaxID=1576542 RepID=A0A9P8VT97_9HYPO|nr:heterokaryon incompatibility protein-domain-containing protein [Thelonectria olida]
MRLINAQTLALEEYFGDQIPQYAILSHTWRDEEATFQAWNDDYYGNQGSVQRCAKGYRKVRTACSKAREQSIQYMWVDTNCINKDSSAELSEAINSMFTWYQRAAMCFVYLDDFEYQNKGSLADLGASRWFTRGWTLQELIAPKTMQFFDASWNRFGTKESLLPRLSSITSIQIQYLMYPDTIRFASISKKMSWAATRSTTREEDMAYCLLGIFEINMPLLYGEGARAFIRLQEEIIRHSNDHTIFCWSWPSSMRPDELPGWNGCLAPRPINFRDSSHYVPVGTLSRGIPSDFQLTNSGLRIRLPIWDAFLDGYKLAILNVQDPAVPDSRLCICLKTANEEMLARSRLTNRLLSIPTSWATGDKDDPRSRALGGRTVFLAHERDPTRRVSTVTMHYSRRRSIRRRQYAICPIYSALDTALLARSRESMCGVHNDSHGPAIGLRQIDGGNVWSASMRVMLHSNPVRLFIHVKIEPPPDAVWHATITLQWKEDGRAGSKHVHLDEQIELLCDSEFSLERSQGPTHVRPMLIRFANLPFS